jgi:hypothetical protein
MLGAAFWCAAVSTADAWQRDLDATPLPSAMPAGDPGTGAPIPAMRADPQIVHAIDGISPSRIQHTIAALVGFRNRNTLSSMEADLPAGTGVSAAADWIEAQFKEISSQCGGCLEVKRDTFTQPAGTEPNSRVRQPTTVTNIYAVLRGTDRDQAARMMLVTGHYDSRATDVMDTHSEAPGANDDASGVAVSLECARALSRLRLPATLVFVAVAGEEQGLFGSRHLAELAKQENWQLEGVLNNDIVGGNRTPGDKLQDAHAVRVFSESLPASATPEEIRRIVLLGYESDSSSRELARAVTDVARTYTEAAGTASRKPSGLEPVLEFRRDRFLRGGDHTSFNQDGFAAVRFTEWREDFNHQHQNVRVENGVQYGDLLQFVDFDYVARVAKLNAATLAVLAAAPPEPVNVTYPQEKVFDNSLNDTTIEWQNTPDTPPGTRYEIVWRATDAPDWQRSIVADKTKSYGVFKGGQTSQFTVTLPVSKDDVIFGVRAVDAAGHRSPAVVPWPARQR